MKNSSKNPAHWRLDTLLLVGSEQVHQLAKVAAGTLTSYRLILGRCLLALQESGAYKEHGCSSSVHYATSVLGICAREARTCRRVAGKLLDLPDLTIAAETGQISWTKLREISRKASPVTEAFWLKLAQIHTYREIEALVRRTPKGSVPGEVEPENQGCSQELRCPLSQEVFVMLEHARRMFSIEKNETVTSAQVVEWALASYISSQPVDSTVLEKVREDVDKDIQAEQARLLPIVESARELAREMLEGDESPEKQSDDALVMALGSIPLTDVRTVEPADPKKHVRVKTQAPSWQNARLRFNGQNRHTTKAQKKELLRRDGWCCNTPGCPNKVWLHLHHLDPYSNGGATEPSNLVCLCSGCHRNLHKGFLRIVPDPTGKLVFLNRQGARLDRQATLERAGWMDYWLGWRGSREISHTAKAMLRIAN